LTPRHDAGVPPRILARSPVRSPARKFVDRMPEPWLRSTNIVDSAMFVDLGPSRARGRRSFTAIRRSLLAAAARRAGRFGLDGAPGGGALGAFGLDGTRAAPRRRSDPPEGA